MNYIYVRLTIFLIGLLFYIPTNSQIVSSNAFLKGEYIEVGVDNTGAFGTDVNAPTGYHPRGGTFGGFSNYLGFVADPDKDGWSTGTPNYIGDYFLPGGVPHEGFSISINNNWNRAWRSNPTATGGFTAGPGSTLSLTGTNTSHYYSGSKVISIWEGTMGDLEITQETSFDTLSLYFLVKVKLKNTGTTDLIKVFYERSVDPENEAEVPGGSSIQTRKIVYQPTITPTVDNRCLTTAVGANFPSLSYMGLGAIDCRAKAFILPSNIYSPNDSLRRIYDEVTTSVLYAVGTSTTQNSGIGIVYNIGTIAAGDSTKLSYAYILSEEYLDSAFASLAPSFETDLGTFADNDTFYGCVGDSVNISITNGEGYSWGNWTPATGLLYPTGSSNVIIIGDTAVTYTIIGETIICTDYDTMQITVVPYVTPDPGIDSFGQICSNADPVNLFTYLGGTPEPGGTWTGPGVTPGGIFDPSGFAEGFYTFTYNTSVASCFDSSQVVIQIINDVNIDFSYEIHFGCDEDTVYFQNLTDSYTYFRWNFDDGTPFDETNVNPVHIYEDQGEYGVWLIAQNAKGCIDSVQKLVEINHPLEAIFEQSADSICQNNQNTVTFTDKSIGDIVSWYWDFGDGTNSNLQNPTHTYTEAGTYTIMLVITDSIPCSDTVYSTVFVDPTPKLNIKVDRDSICAGEMITITADFIPSAIDMYWDFGDGSNYSLVTDTQTHSYTNPGTYYIKVTSFHEICPSITAYDTIFVKPYPILNLGPDTMICLHGSPIYIDASALTGNPSNTTYYWSTGDSNAILRIVSPGIYYAYADLDGCITRDQLEVEKDCYIDVPNSFTPNGDGNNDYFFPRQHLSEGVVDFKMSIYNRWGQKVFETNNVEGRGWDGKFNDELQPTGVYIYQISVRYKNLAAEKYTGNVTLLR